MICFVTIEWLVSYQFHLAQCTNHGWEHSFQTMCAIALYFLIQKIYSVLACGLMKVYWGPVHLSWDVIFSWTFDWLYLKSVVVLDALLWILLFVYKCDIATHWVVNEHRCILIWIGNDNFSCSWHWGRNNQQIWSN